MKHSKKGPFEPTQSRNKKQTTDRPSGETRSRKKASESPTSPAKREIDSKQRTRQAIPEKNLKQSKEASNNMKAKVTTEDKLGKNKVRKLRAVSSFPPPADLENEIRERAYQLYLENPQSSSDANWIKAEAEIRAKYSDAADE